MTNPIEALAADTMIAAVGTAFSATYGIAYPGIDFTPANATSVYLDVSILPNGSAYQPVSGNDTHQGILQVAVMYPTAGGAIKPLEVAGAVADAFDKASRFFGAGHSVKVSTRPVIGQPFPNDGYIRVPVTISYQATKD
ncbi:DUF4128 domain-containing protein [Hoeflea sp. G2-23]|uniref:DUF4128 domain-containing protein n=1 Tax=Hoeflea algicola TaxID=2983763 RepID=A0ABT3ZGE5_9HYPH|nr:phage tail terminator-like protein [Hoeflea algicola]MCY0150882.1 DUF4128 domain-containing protein [Hoeflea algicola]